MVEGAESTGGRAGRVHEIGQRDIMLKKRSNWEMVKRFVNHVQTVREQDERMRPYGMGVEKINIWYKCQVPI